jgi:cardiolipin synthase
MLISFLFALAYGCLPDVEEVVQKPAGRRPPDVVGPSGPLPPEKSQAVFDRLQRDAGQRGILDRHIRVAQEAGESPLILGNKVSLLEDGPATYEAMFQALL